jgi:hypothetical protein
MSGLEAGQVLEATSPEVAVMSCTTRSEALDL